jgi:HEAT repeat protein
MPSSAEIQVMRMLSAIDGALDSAAAIEAMGSEAVTVVCEAALGSYPGLPSRGRKNAVALLGRLSHPQATETLPLLIHDADADIAIRAMRAAGRTGNKAVVADLADMLADGAVSALIAAEALKALAANGSAAAMKIVDGYRKLPLRTMKHRRSNVVRSVFRRIDSAVTR